MHCNPGVLSSPSTTLSKGVLALYKLTRVEHKKFTFSAGFKSLSIDNAILNPFPERLLFTMIRNADVVGSQDTKPYNLRHYIIIDFSLLKSGKRVPSEGLSLNIDHEKTSVIGYRTVFEVSSIHQSKSGLQVTHPMYIIGYFIVIFDLTPNRNASEGHKTHRENGNIRFEVKFNKPLTEAITCLLYLEYDNSAIVDFSRNVMTEYEDGHHADTVYAG